MGNIQFLDCTLREVALPQYHWGEETMHAVLESLCSAGVEIIECGFLKNGSYPPGSSLFQDTKSIDALVGGVKERGCQIAALMDYGRFQISTLPHASQTLLDIVRVCFKKHERYAVLEDIAGLIQKGYRVFVQHVDIPSYTDDEIRDFIERINPLHPTCYCMVDTFGTMYVEDLQRIWSMVDDLLADDISIGIHGHNNLMMANALAMYMIRCHGRRNLIVDGTLLGAGRGAGNANTEILLYYLCRTQEKTYDLLPIYQIVDKIQPVLDEKYQYGYSLPYFQTGILAAHVFNADYLTAHYRLTSVQRMQLLQKLTPEQKIKYDYAQLDRLVSELQEDAKNDPAKPDHSNED